MLGLCITAWSLSKLGLSDSRFLDEIVCVGGCRLDHADEPGFNANASGEEVQALCWALWWNSDAASPCFQYLRVLASVDFAGLGLLWMDSEWGKVVAPGLLETAPFLLYAPVVRGGYRKL